MQSGEFISGQEADSDSLLGLVDLVMRQSEQTRQETGVTGIYSKYISDTEHLAVQVRLRPGDRPPILDGLRLVELPNVITSLSRIHDSKVSDNPLILQSETEEMWVTNTDGLLTARKRVYGYDQLNYPALQTLSESEKRAASDYLAEHLEVQRVKQAAIDQEEELLGLNRVSVADIDRFLGYLGM